MKVKAYQIRSKSEKELLTDLDELKQKLVSLRVSKALSSTAGKVAEIRTVRKNIARTLTVYNQARKDAARASFAGKKYVPLDLRSKLTRAKRRALTPAQYNKKTAKEQTRKANFPMRKYAVAA
ncbi:ribosomal protein L35, putative [Perkinsus marinus ATCC 50983]|uniref:Ribosomal protein L35, putative n=1 Tax=Perkinsus marinus (strain ATCC 50983 / TXsc) TaxID=423536 RepID=C5LH52_PERM5|nr:ribosomal protein L35, putative [Perkinsus marinus ATCC 50983]XP_002772045.1 ribosomal protein L35, putative [Perkinsus marinus ATCC 50983]EER02936.1 ribosomal protein L35, putative [Perkinsus marinus ATCC 50983]EER03861.1 ribosomal protein L35, putative [Perkinsus marinus ATCC 50983]|eukprot:XP_002771120.1 ribosomal protein L35, putative [Perkinsus marinus ATCC 50983]